MSNSEPTERAGGVREAAGGDAFDVWWKSLPRSDRNEHHDWFARIAFEAGQEALSPPSAPAEGVVKVKAGIYIASKAAHGARWRGLRASGVPIISTWIDEAEAGATSNWPDLWHRCIREAREAAVTIVYREEGEVLKGAFVEMGAALAAGRTVFAVGCDEFSVRYHMRVVPCATLDEALELAREYIRALTAAPAEVDDPNFILVSHKVAAAGLKAMLPKPATPAEGVVKVKAGRQDRSPAWNAIFATLRDYRMSNMCDDIGGNYPLVDLMSNDGSSIATGEEEMAILADEISIALTAAPAEVRPYGEVMDELDHAYRIEQETPEGGAISSAELIRRCGGDPDAPFERGPFPPEMRQSPADRAEDRIRQRCRNYGLAKVEMKPRRWVLTEAGLKSLAPEPSGCPPKEGDGHGD